MCLEVMEKLDTVISHIGDYVLFILNVNCSFLHPKAALTMKYFTLENKQPQQRKQELNSSFDDIQIDLTTEG